MKKRNCFALVGAVTTAFTLGGVAGTVAYDSGGQGTLAAATPAVSDWAPMLEKGTQELSVGGQLRLKNLSDIDYDLRLKYGWFIRDKWELGITGEFVDFGQGRRIGLGVFTEYNFDLGSRWVPYVGAAAKWGDASFDNLEADAVIFTGEIGVKYFIRSHMSIYAAINFEWSPDEIFSLGDDIADNAQNIILGMRFYF